MDITRLNPDRGLVHSPVTQFCILGGALERVIIHEYSAYYYRSRGYATLIAGANWAWGASRTTKLFLWYRGKLFLVGGGVGLGKAHYTAVPFFFS